jgi:hypothetical protein
MEVRERSVGKMMRPRRVRMRPVRAAELTTERAGMRRARQPAPTARPAVRPDGAPGPDGSSACLDTGIECTNAVSSCCKGNACVYDTTDPGASIYTLCHSLCTSNVQCNSGCCAPVDGVGKVCAIPSYCTSPPRALRGTRPDQTLSSRPPSAALTIVMRMLGMTGCIPCV